MNNIELGKKIRETRISKRMTQNDVVGTFITRNMLSQIENGTASPSIKTLEHIAKALDIPLEQLVISESGDETETAAGEINIRPSDTDCISTLVKAKDKYLDKCYQDVIELMEPLAINDSPFYDEASALIAKSCYRLADAAFKSGNTSAANDFANRAVLYAGNGIYSNDELMIKAYRIIKETAAL